MEGKAVDPLRQHILEAVDCLRQRKCRPDRESIAHYVLRKFGSTMNEIFAELENIVDENGLIKVEYKGTTSYRSPSSFDTKNSPLLTKHSKILNSSKTTRFILTGINELLVKDPNYAKEGVPLHELKEALVGFDGVRFGEENMDVVLEREKNYGSIQIAKSTILADSLRVFPKDIPVPADMIRFSLSTDIPLAEKEDKKPRKPRKSNATSVASAAAGSSPAKKLGKGKAKNEAVDEVDEKPTAVFAVKSDPPLETEIDNSKVESPTPKKNARLTSVGRKSVADKVAEAVKKTYAAKSEFETKSAQMIKLAAAVVNKQVEEPSKQKAPILVLAESIKSKSSNGESSHVTDPPKNKQEETISSGRGSAAGNKRRGRPPTNLDVDKDDDSKDEKYEDDEADSDKVSPSNDQGLTRSKRDKRKKQVFDPSDLPKTYSNYSNSLKATRKSRVTRSPSHEEPPVKKAVVARPSRASQRKSIPVASEEKRVSRSSSRKSNSESQTNKKNLQNLETPNDEGSNDSEHMDTEDAEKGGKMPSREDPENNEVKKEISATLHSEKKSIPASKDEKRCEYCPEKKKNSPVEEEFLTCASCLSNIHPRCMDYSLELTTRIREFDQREGSKRIPWKCFDCKTCGVCHQRLFDSVSSKRASSSNSSKSEMNKNDKTNALQYILCEHCDVGFHAKCTNVETTKTDAWICQECKGAQNVKKQINSKVKSESQTENKSTPLVAKKRVGRSLQSKANSDKSQKPSPITTKSEVEKLKIKEECAPVSGDSDTQSEDKTDSSETLDITSWSPSEVEAFFIDKGLKEEAAILREQDVDGYSLLLLRREDIIHGLRLRLGPALKVNRLIYELQAKAPVRAKWHDAETSDHEADAPAPDTSQR